MTVNLGMLSVEDADEVKTGLSHQLRKTKLYSPLVLHGQGR